MKKYLTPINKFAKAFFQVFIWPLIRRAVIFIGIFALLIYAGGKVNWVPIENWMIDKITHQEPIGKQTYMPFQGKVDVVDTKAYKKEKYLIFKTNIKNTVRLIASKVGMVEKSKKHNFTSVSVEMTKNSKYKDLSMSQMALVDEQTTNVALSDWEIIKTNLTDGMNALKEMLSVRILTEDGKPMIVKIVENKQVVIEYDSSDNVMRWGKEIQASSTKYGINPAIIAAVIEQESGGKQDSESSAGAIGLMQLMPRTAEGLGVNPYDPVQNIEGGTKYLAMQLQRFGSLELALAAYNAGPGNVLNSKYLYFSETQNYMRNVPALINKYEQKFAAALSEANGSSQN